MSMFEVRKKAHGLPNVWANWKVVFSSCHYRFALNFMKTNRRDFHPKDGYFLRNMEHHTRSYFAREDRKW